MANTIATRIALTGADDMRADLAKLGQAGEGAFAKLQTAAGRVQFDKLQKGATDTGKSLQQVGQVGQQAGQQVATAFQQSQTAIKGADEAGSGLGSRLATVAAVVTGIGVALAVAFSKATDSMVKAGGEAVDKLEKTSERLGITVEQVQRIGTAAKESGVGAEELFKAMEGIDKEATKLGASSETISNGMKVVARTFGETTTRVTSFDTKFVGTMGSLAKSGEAVATGFEGVNTKITTFFNKTGQSVQVTETFAKALQQIGINAKTFIAADNAERLVLLAKGFSQTTDGATKNSAALEILKDKWRTLLPLFEQGPEALRKFLDPAKSKLEGLSAAEVKALSDWTESQGDLNDALDLTKQKLGAIFAPGKTATNEWLTDLIVKNREYILGLVQTAKLQTEAFFKSTFGPSPLETIFVRLKAAAETAWPIIKAGAQATWGFLSKLFSGDFGAVWATLGEAGAAAWDFIKARAIEAWQFFQTQFPTAAAAVSATFQGMATAVNVVIGAINLLGGLLDPIATMLNRMFGTELTGAQLLATGLFLRLAGVIDGLIGPMTAFVGTVALVSGAFEGLRQTYVLAFGLLDQALDIVKGKFTETFGGLTAFFQTVAVSINEQLRSIGVNINWDAIGQAIRDAFGGAVDFVMGKLQSLMDFLSSVADKISSLGTNSTIGSGSGDALGGAVSGFARGGSVRGPGTGTSDSILARLSAGEFVLRAAVVRKLGLPLLNALNGFKGLSFKDGLPGFATGGLVPALSLPSLDGVGGSGRTVNVNLTMPGGETFALMAPEHIADGLTRYASKSAMRSGGAKPSWYR